MTAPKALIIDDEPDICHLISLSLSRMNIQSESVHNFHDALELLKHHQYQICFTDMRLPDGDGLDLLMHIQQNNPNMPVAVITAHGTMDCAITALKRGAFDFVSKPIDLNILRDLALTALKLNEQVQCQNSDILGQSKSIIDLRAKITKISRSQAPIYVSGPSGCGKELVSKVIHHLSPRQDQPFIAINCGAIPKELMESEFFGHLKGSFTGAHQDREGLFQAAHRGTLLLDEVADLPLDMQVKLLRAIQERAIRPIGQDKEITVDVRILSATHKNLFELVEQGAFREDLFYRLNVIELKVPSLKERLEDIPLLVQHIINKLSLAQDNLKPEISQDALSALQAYAFPGNVRELENILERAFALCDGKTITAKDLHLRQADVKQTRANQAPLDNYLDDVERQAILDALDKASGNKTKAAKLLGITFRALRYKLKKLNLD